MHHPCSRAFYGRAEERTGPLNGPLCAPCICSSVWRSGISPILVSQGKASGAICRKAAAC
jgi:hypothetical protein